MENVDELRRLERLCLEQAELCVVPEARHAMLVMAKLYRDAISRSVIAGNERRLRLE
jgi:hypothetical protein